VTVGRRGRQRLVIPFIVPALAVYSVFFVFPAGRAFWVSLHKWSGFGATMVYVGLGNYREMLSDGLFWQAFRRTLQISLGGGIGIFGFALFFSAILQRKIRGRKFFRALVFFPIVVPGIGLGLIWQFIYNNSWGPLSAVLELIGLSGLDRTWLGPTNIITSLTVAVVWTFTGYYLVLLMAGIDKIPQTFFEAAVMDGSSHWAMFFKITLPMIWDVMRVALLLWAIGSLKIFDLIAATLFPAPTTSAYTITIYIWAQAIGIYTPVFRLGYATALGVVLLVMVVVAVSILRLVTRSEQIEY
jgi:ABC-type sugar transport system permease subunit